jgi:hypothetical protein
MAFAGTTSPDFSDGRSFVMGLASAAESNMAAAARPGNSPSHRTLYRLFTSPLDTAYGLPLWEEEPNGEGA